MKLCWHVVFPVAVIYRLLFFFLLFFEDGDCSPCSAFMCWINSHICCFCPVQSKSEPFLKMTARPFFTNEYYSGRGRPLGSHAHSAGSRSFLRHLSGWFSSWCMLADRPLHPHAIKFWGFLGLTTSAARNCRWNLTVVSVEYPRPSWCETLTSACSLTVKRNCRLVMSYALRGLLAVIGAIIARSQFVPRTLSHTYFGCISRPNV